MSRCRRRRLARLTPRPQTKAQHYIDLLEAARCDGNWTDVPELVRKVRKHAPDRKCTSPQSPWRATC